MIIKIDLKSITIRCKKRMFCKAKRARTHRKLDNRTAKKRKRKIDNITSSYTRTSETTIDNQLDQVVPIDERLLVYSK
jgi:hypothetical protein